MADSEFYLEMGFAGYLAYLNSFNPIDIERVNINDIVWAQSGSLYWPAVLTDVYEEGILKLWFVHNPYESIERSVTEVMAFLDMEEIRDEAISIGCVETFDKIKELAMQYMSRKSEGHQEDPIHFFLSANSDVLNKIYEANYLEALKESGSPTKCIRVLETIQEDSQEEYFEEYYKVEVPDEAEAPDQAEEHVQAVECDEELCEEHVHVEQQHGIQPIGLLRDDKDKEDTNVCSSSSLESTPPTPITMENSYVKQLVSYIKHGSVKYYLFQVLKGEKSSFFYELYKKCMKIFTTQKLTKICYGPIDDVEILKDLIPYLIAAYRNMLEELPESVRVPECEPYFIAAVWLPEALVYAISCHNDITIYDAYEVFIQSAVLKSDYLRYVEENRPGSAVPVTKMSGGLDVPSNDGCRRPSTPKPSLQFFDALEIVNDVVFVDKMDCKTYFAVLEEKMQKLQEERSKTRE